MVARNSKRTIAASLDLSKSQEYIAYVNNVINSEFEAIKNEFINQFDKHPVTREIEAGHSSSNISNTLGGKGNLFSFIGFEKNDKPTEVIRNLLNSKTHITKILTKKDGSFSTFAQYPMLPEIYAVTPMPWAPGRSWAEGIERGISGLGYYMNKPGKNSRSGKGLQSNSLIRNLSFAARPYMSEIIRWFQNQILKLNRKTIL